MSKSYRQSHTSSGYGNSYHKKFSDTPFRRMIWEEEQIILDLILKKNIRKSNIHYLDFACGTGRILSHLENHMASSVGVDVSQSMLGVAKDEVKKAKLIQADLTKNDVLGKDKFDLITAFRFFPNAEPSLRKEAMHVIKQHLDQNGYFIFNNHKNTGSLRNRLAKFFGRTGFEGLSLSEINILLSENNLKIIKVFPLSIFPSSEIRPLLSIPVLRFTNKLLSYIPFLRNYGENLIFLCALVKD